MNSLEQISFDYGLLNEDDREFVQQKSDEIHGQLKRTAEGIIRIGRNLIAVKKRLEDNYGGRGHYEPWLHAEFDMSHSTAKRFMQVARRFNEETNLVSSISTSVLYELAAPSTPDIIIEQVQTGEIPPNLDAIKEAKAAQKRAEEAEKQASEQAQSAQQQLFTTQSQAQTKIDELTQQIASLQGEMQELKKSEEKIIEKEVIPEETLQRLQALQKQVERLAYERDNEIKRADSFAQKYQEDMTEREEAKNHERIRQNWRSIVSQTHSSLMRLLAQWPTLVDTQSFEADDWAHVDHLKNTLRRVQEECDNLHSREDDMIIDATPARG
jgi:myosin heavy subunit